MIAYSATPSFLASLAAARIQFKP